MDTDLNPYTDNSGAHWAALGSAFLYENANGVQWNSNFEADDLYEGGNNWLFANIEGEYLNANGSSGAHWTTEAEQGHSKEYSYEEGYGSQLVDNSDTENLSVDSGVQLAEAGPGGGGAQCPDSTFSARYYINGNGNLLAEYGVTTNPSAPIYNFIYAGSERIAMRRIPDGALHYYLNDHLGSARVVIDSAYHFHFLNPNVFQSPQQFVWSLVSSEYKNFSNEPYPGFLLCDSCSPCCRILFS